MKGHSHTHRRAVGPGECLKRLLRGCGSYDRRLATAKRDERAVSLRLELDTALRLDWAQKYLAVCFEEIYVAFAELLRESSRPLDVGEE
jgi:hypothetical protein